MPQPIPYVIALDGLTMNTTQANDKLIPPQMLVVENIELVRRGRGKKTYGYNDLSTNVSPDLPAGEKINAISPNIQGYLGNQTNSFQVCISDDLFYFHNEIDDAWVVSPSATANKTPGDTYPWNLAWGINTTGVPVAYFAGTGGVFGIEGVTGAALKYGASGSAPWTVATSVEFHLDKLFVGKPTVSGTVESDRLYWSETGDDNGWSTAGGSGFIEMRDPGGGSAASSQGITGLRVYRQRLYIATQNTLYALTGTTSATFGKRRITDCDSITGSTFYVVGSFLFWTDQIGIWQFNGTESRNVMTDAMFDRWTDLNAVTDIGAATASWDEQEGIYRVYFPVKKEMWNFHYRTGQWDIRTFNSTDDVRVIGPPCNLFAGKATNFTLGSLTNGKVWKANDQFEGDDGGIITASIKTGHLRLGELNGGRIGDRARLLYIDIEANRQNDPGVVKVDVTIDGKIQYDFKSPGGTGLIAEHLDTSEILVTVDGSHGLIAPFTMKVDDEEMNCTSLSGDVFTVTRGYNLTTAAEHADNTPYTYDGETGLLEIADANGGADSFPTVYDGNPNPRIDLGDIDKAGRIFQFRIWDDNAAGEDHSRMDLRYFTIWYERLENAGSRPA